MASEQLPAGIDLGADGLGNTENDAAQRLPRPPMITASKPKISRPPPMEGSKLVRIPRRMPATAVTASDSAIETEDVASVQAHQLGDVLIVGNSAKGAAERCSIKGPLQGRDDQDGDEEGQKRQHADGKTAKADARGLQSAGVHFLRIGGVTFEQRVLDNDG